MTAYDGNVPIPSAPSYICYGDPVMIAFPYGGGTGSSDYIYTTLIPTSGNMVNQIVWGQSSSSKADVYVIGGTRGLRIGGGIKEGTTTRVISGSVISLIRLYSFSGDGSGELATSQSDLEYVYASQGSLYTGNCGIMNPIMTMVITSPSVQLGSAIPYTDTINGVIQPTIVWLTFGSDIYSNPQTNQSNSYSYNNMVCYTIGAGANGSQQNIQTVTSNPNDSTISFALQFVFGYQQISDFNCCFPQIPTFFNSSFCSVSPNSAICTKYFGYVSPTTDNSQIYNPQEQTQTLLSNQRIIPQQFSYDDNAPWKQRLKYIGNKNQYELQNQIQKRNQIRNNNENQTNQNNSYLNWTIIIIFILIVVLIAMIFAAYVMSVSFKRSNGNLIVVPYKSNNF